MLNVAVTFFAASMISVQVTALPLHAPDQPPNWEPGFAAAVSVTDEFRTSPSLQSIPQLMPAGLDETAPLPLTATLSSGTSSNLAVTVVLPFIVTLQAGTIDPSQAPPAHCTNVLPGSACAIRSTTEF
jgi:hypothetical protein